MIAAQRTAALDRARKLVARMADAVSSAAERLMATRALERLVDRWGFVDDELSPETREDLHDVSGWRALVLEAVVLRNPTLEVRVGLPEHSTSAVVAGRGRRPRQLVAEHTRVCRELEHQAERWSRKRMGFLFLDLVEPASKEDWLCTAAQVLAHRAMVDLERSGSPGAPLEQRAPIALLEGPVAPSLPATDLVEAPSSPAEPPSAPPSPEPQGPGASVPPWAWVVDAERWASGWRWLPLDAPDPILAALPGWTRKDDPLSLVSTYQGPGGMSFLVHTPGLADLPPEAVEAVGRAVRWAEGRGTTGRVDVQLMRLGSGLGPAAWRASVVELRP